MKSFAPYRLKIMEKNLGKKIIRHILFFAFLAVSCSTSDPTQPGVATSACPLVWQDDFTSGLSNRWSIADWSFDHNLCEFSSNMVTVTDGLLWLGVARKSVNRGLFPEKPYWGGEVYTASSYLYGKFEAVMKPNAFPGMVASFFLMEAVNDTDGALVDWYEIDIEFAGKTNEISFALHWMENKVLKSSVKKAGLDFDAAKEFHKYTIEWTPTAVQFLVDDSSVAIFDDPAILKEFQHKMSLHMNYWVSDYADWVGAFHESILPQQTAYESVAYYQLVDA